MKKFSALIKLVAAGFCAVALCMLLNNIDAHAANAINKTTLSLIKGESIRLTISNPSTTVKWKSGNKKVATVSSKGLVKAKKKGKTYIYATIGKKQKKCFVRVNNTLSVDNSELTISEPTTINIRYTDKGTVSKKLTSTKIIESKWGKWTGDYLSLNLVPLKKGDEVIKITNTQNSEIAVIKVHIKEIKPQFSFVQPQLSNDAKSFIAGENKIKLSFTATQNLDDSVVNIIDSENVVVNTITCGAIKKNVEKTVEWDGLKSDGTKCSGEYSYAVVSGKYEFLATNKIEVLGVSPFGNGDGSKENPYGVSSVDEFAKIKEYNGANFVLDSDIDFKSGRFDSSNFGAFLFTEEEPFEGTLNGKPGDKQYIISNLLGWNSVFGYIGENGVLMNLQFTRCSTSADKHSAALAHVNKGVISNVSIEGSLLSTKEGAMLVDDNYGLIENSLAAGQIRLNYEATELGAVSILGGGLVVNNYGRITGCESKVSIYAHTVLDKPNCYQPYISYEQYMGAIAAYNDAIGIISGCTNSGNMEGVFKIPSDYKTENMTLLENGNESATNIANNMFRYIGYVAGKNAGMIIKPANKNKSLTCDATGYNIGIVQAE